MIKIICVGKIKEKFYEEAVREYKKRIEKYIKLKVIEVKDYEYENDIKKGVSFEKNEILKQTSSDEYIILLDIKGVELKSEEFADNMNKIFIKNSNITFIIGGSNGVDLDIKKICNQEISFSKLTFPHQLFRVILLEQIYRAFKIISNEKYHK